MKKSIFNAVCLGVLATIPLAVIDCSGENISGEADGGAATGVGESGAGGGGSIGSGGASETGGGGSSNTGGSATGAGGVPATGAGGNRPGTGGASGGTGGASTGSGGATTGSGGATTGSGGTTNTGAGGGTGAGGNTNNTFCPAAEPAVGSECTAPPAEAGPGADACRYTNRGGMVVDCTCRMNGARDDAGRRVDTWACTPVVVRPDAGGPPPMDAGLRDTCPAAAVANLTNCAAFVTGLMCPGAAGRTCTCRALGVGGVKTWNCAARAPDAGGD